MRWCLALCAAAALVAVTGGCGSTITVPDQGIIVTGCQMPAACYRANCECTRASVLGSGTGTPSCVAPSVCSDPNNPSTCNCQPITVGDMGVTVATQCLEPAQTCVGRGVFCGGVGAVCLPAGTSCAMSSSAGTPPQLIPTVGMPMLEPHCQFTDDVCCPGSDGGVTTD
jgi:hypothetical protein